MQPDGLVVELARQLDLDPSRGDRGAAGQCERHPGRAAGGEGRAAAAVAVIDAALQLVDAQVVAGDARKSEASGRAGSDSAEQDRQLGTARPDGDRRRGGQGGIVGAQRHIGALDGAGGGEEHLAVETGTAKIDAPGKRPGRGLDDGAAPGLAGQIQTGDVDGDRRGGGADQAARRRRAIVRGAARVEAPAARSRGDATADLRQADAEAGPRQHQIDDRRVDRSRQHQLHRAIVARRAGAVEPDDAVGGAGAGGDKRQSRRRQPGIAEGQRRVGGDVDVGGDARQAAEKTAEKAVVEAGDLDRGSADDPCAAGRRDHTDIGTDVGNAEPRQQIAGQLALGGDKELVAAKPGDGGGGAAQPVGAEGQRVRGELAAGDGQRPVDADVAQQCPGGLADAGDRAGGGADRHHQRAVADADDARRDQIGRLGLAPRRACRRQAIVDERVLESPGQPRGEPDIAAGDAPMQRRRVEQPRRDRDIAQGLGAEVETATHRCRQGAAGEIDVDRRDALGEPRGAGDARHRAGQPGCGPGQQSRRLEHAVERELAVARRQRQVGERLATQTPAQLALPDLPAAVAPDAEVERCGQTRHRGDCPAARRGDHRVEVEDIAVGFRIELDPHPVAAPAAERRRGEVDQRATGADVGAAADGDDPPHAADRRFEDQPVDPQPPDGDVDVGQDALVETGA